MFRQVMRDLNFEGEEPIWEKMDMLEKIQQSDKGSGDNQQQHQMNEILRLKKEKAELATELQRHQDLLK